MKKLLILIVVLIFANGVLALPDTSKTSAEVNPSNGHATVVIPANAVEVAPGIFDLGNTVDQGERVEGYAFVHYKKGQVTSHSKPARGSDVSNCYGFMAKGAKWKIIEDYMVDPTNTESLNESYLRANLAGNINKWEDAADGILNGAIKNIIGNEIAGTVDGADMVQPDNKNEVYFADVEDPGAIAVTIVWGVFGGPIYNRRLVEWDQVFDQVDFDWSTTGDPLKMDFEEIATHELGHTFGLNDLYDSFCQEQTMFGYATEGETKKRSLEVGDIKGVKTLYS